MKPLYWPTTKEQMAHMVMRKGENLIQCERSKAEAWMWKKLCATRWKWSRQAIWGYRLYDFWCHSLGCAIEVDGPEHDPGIDAFKDEWNFRRSGIVVLRVPNMDEEVATRAVLRICKLAPWRDRRMLMGIEDTKPRARQKLALQHPERKMLQAFLYALD